MCNHKTSPNYPIEEARLRHIWYPSVVAFGCMEGYGSSLANRAVSTDYALSFLVLSHIPHGRAFGHSMHTW